MDVIYIIGHKNPDTDSVCSAIALADFYMKQAASEEGEDNAKQNDSEDCAKQEDSDEFVSAVQGEFLIYYSAHAGIRTRIRSSASSQVIHCPTRAHTIIFYAGSRIRTCESSRTHAFQACALPFRHPRYNTYKFFLNIFVYIFYSSIKPLKGV